ncbi:MAG: hypothetical protein GEV07_22095 [Streptosporangiales bacterium]|nr:hypothetical protein [Streptosporangiales bacterium]
MSRRFATIPRAAAECGVTYNTVRARIKNKQLKVFRLGNRNEHVVDLDEAKRVLAKTRSYGVFDGAEVIDLSRVVVDDAEVLR